MADGLIERNLLCGKELLESNIASLRYSLRSKREDLKKIAVNVSVRLTGAVRKNEIIDHERLIGMAKIGAIRRSVCNDDDSEALLSISYLTEDMKRVLIDFPAFSSVVQWGKQLKDILNDFTFMNLLIYLV